MVQNIPLQEQEDIENALDAGKMITLESTRRVLSQGEIDKIVDAYNELVSSRTKLEELLEEAKKLNASADTRTDFTVKCEEFFPEFLDTLNALR